MKIDVSKKPVLPLWGWIVIVLLVGTLCFLSGRMSVNPPAPVIIAQPEIKQEEVPKPKKAEVPDEKRLVAVIFPIREGLVVTMVLPREDFKFVEAVKKMIIVRGDEVSIHIKNTTDKDREVKFLLSAPGKEASMDAIIKAGETWPSMNTFGPDWTSIEIVVQK